MTTYRNLQAGAHPPTDPRRAAALRAFLRRLAPALTPRWAPTGGRDDFGSALLEIAARLGEETTRRLDRTAERDAIAFFDFLGLPPTPPRAATGVLVLALAKGHLLPVFAPARTQVVAATTKGEEVTFETQHGLRVVPGQIAELVAVDPTTDRIELAPAQVTSLERPAVIPGSYEVVSFAATGSHTLQVSPAVGLTAEDVLRIGTAAHRIAEFDGNNGLVTLHDPLEAPAAAGAAFTRIGSLESFTMRDLQHHALYIGHSELFDLEQPAEISLVLAPPALARELAGLDVAYAMFGTKDGDSEPDWHPLDLLGTTGSTIQLGKPEVGSVDKVEVHGHKSRWLRAELRGPVNRRPGLTSRASGVRLAVASMDPRPAGTSASPAVDGGSSSGPAEGSRTIARAFHNGTPLSTARRFYPFGPEPLRFDVFALAAPEALSKKGAEVTLDVTMVDSSLASFEIAAAAIASAPRGYGAGQNGDLQVLSFQPGGSVRWQELKVVAADGQRLLLSDAAAVNSALAGYEADLVVVTDRAGQLWSATIRWSGDPPIATVESGGWRSLPARRESHSSGQASVVSNGRPAGPVVVPTPTGVVGVAAVLLDVSQGALHALKVDDNGGTDKAGWQPVSGQPSPVLTGPWQITPVQGEDWPIRPAKTEVVAISEDGTVWLGVIGSIDSAQPVTVAWDRLVAPTGSTATASVDVRPAAIASVDVGPAATRFRPVDGAADLWVAYAGPGSDRRLHGLIRTGDGTAQVDPDPQDVHVAAGTALHANPAVLGVGGLPVTVGLGPGPDEALIWRGRSQITTSPLPGEAGAGGPLLLQTGPSAFPELVLGGAGERLFRTAVDRPLAIGYGLHDVVEISSTQVAHRVEITDAPDDPASSTMIELSASNRRIVEGNVRLYQVDTPRLTIGATLRFLRLADSAYTASFDDPAHRDQLRLDATDQKETKQGRRLVIGDASYLVIAVSNDRVATLEQAVLGDSASPEYRSARVLGTSTVAGANLRTLVELATAARIDPPAVLDFGFGTLPAPQQLKRQEVAGQSVWAQLEDGWAKPPPDQGRAALLGASVPPTWTVDLRERGYQNPELSWEYFDGAGWRRLDTDFLDGTDNMSSTGPVRFVVPGDLSTTEIGGKDDYWIRARLIGGDYGRPHYVVQTAPTTTATVTVQTVTVDTSSLRPPEILAIEAAYTLTQQIAPEIMLVENNLDVLDQTQAAAVAAARFELFQGASAIDVDTADRALYVGLAAPIGTGSLVLLADTADQNGSGALRVDLRTADGWRRATVDDRTESLRRRGMVTISLDVDPVLVRLFGRERVWLRLRPEPAGGAPSTAAAGPGAAGAWAPVVHGLYLNAVELSHARTLENEILGSGQGEPGTTVELAEQPVLPDTVRLRVRERLSDEERAALEAEHEAAAGPGRGASDPVVLSDLERIPGSWVLWRRVDSLIGQDGDARVYVLDPSSGRVTFGDDRNGKIPPAGRDSIRAFSYQQGGGAAGNMPAWSEVKLTSAVEGVDTAVLPVDSVGGFSAPAAESLFATAPDRLRHAGRAMSPADVEALAVASSADIVRAHCARPAGPREPISVTIAVRDGSRCPVPTLAQRDAVAAFVRNVGWGGLGEGSIEVKEPTYIGVAVTVHLVAPRNRLADVEQTAKTILIDLFHPVDGGPDGSGWPFGRRPTSSDLLRALSDVDGLDRVASIDITPLGNRSLDQLPADGLVCARTTDITVVVTSVEEAP